MTKQRRSLQYVGTVLRWCLGGLFLYMGLKKAIDPVDFLKLVRQYQITDIPWVLNSIAATLPWFEAFCGVLLLLGVAVRGTAVITAGMLVPFTIMVIKRAFEIGKTSDLAFCLLRFDCGCGAGEVYICQKILENLLLTVVAIWLASGLGLPLSLRYSLFHRPHQRRLRRRRRRVTEFTGSTEIG
jgi:uncharacterized membrane protein YphA (DoxX/SURF4 family)